MELLDLKSGEKALIRHWEGTAAWFHAWQTLGFTPGAPVTVVRKDESGPMLVSIRGARVALGREEATFVEGILATQKT